MIYQSITQLIGNTPLFEIPKHVHGIPSVRLLMKCEFLNPWGSVKDRTAWGMIRHHIQDIVDNKKTIIELSSGNTAKALQLLASVHGVNFTTITNRIKVPEQRDILQVLGAEVRELPGKSDCYDPNDPHDPMVIIQQEMQKNPGQYFFTDQYMNKENVAIHQKETAQEILQEVDQVNYFFSGLGTAGSSRGIAATLQEHFSDMQTIGVVAEKDDHIPGIRNRDEMMQVGIFDPKLYKDITSIHSTTAIRYMLQLVQQVGLLVGPTTGASYGAAIEYLKAHAHGHSEEKTVLFLGCDRLEWYMSYIKERCPELFGGAAKKSWRELVTDSDLHTVMSISIDTVHEWINKMQPIIIDIRMPISFRVAHIPGALNYPAEMLSTLFMTTNPFPKDQPILLCCPVGEESRMYTAWLQKQGVKAYSLEGGITAWRDAGFSLERNKK